MTEMLQMITLYMIIGGAVGYASWRIYQTFRRANDPCYGCGGCALKDIRKAAKRKKRIVGTKNRKNIWQCRIILLPFCTRI